MKITLVGAYQDGAQFYRESDGKLLVNYNTAKHKQVLHDYDIKGCEQARERFAKQFPQHIKS